MSHPTPVVQGTTLAKLFRLDKARFDQLVQEKVVPENAQGQFELVASVRGYVMHLQTRAQGQADKTIDIKSQQLRRMKAQADELELELACMQAQSHPVRDVKTRWSRKVVAVKIGFLSMADRLAQMLTLAETDRDVMDQAIRSVLIGLSAKDETAPSTASQAALKAGVMRLYCPPPNLTVTQWAEANRILSRENCALPGPYRVSVTPYLKEMLDCITERTVERVVCQKSAQVAWTDGVINNAVGYYIDQDPAPMLILFPTDGMAKRYSKEKLAPMIRDTPPLTEKVADAKSRDSGNTLESKNFQGGHLELVGSNAPSKLASSPIRIIMVEEPDRCSRNAGGEGNSLKLVYERGKTFHNRKIILGGSPTIKGVSEIEREMELSDQRRLYIACPHCQAYQTLEWAQVVWDQDEARNHSVYGQHDPDTARFTCKHCEQDFSNAQKNKALLQGEWRADKPFNGTAGFYLSELHSPFPVCILIRKK